MSSKKESKLPLGIAIGTAVGIATDKIGLWIPMGIAIGVAIGAFLQGITKEN
ncbi:hypothetical protein [Winogradskyella poriferorum]|uniref:hypothetical protein n=1 Tax=Winogradskyella poriferorum TaxID=307627 RepID=UPI003D65774A